MKRAKFPVQFVVKIGRKVLVGRFVVVFGQHGGSEQMQGSLVGPYVVKSKRLNNDVTKMKDEVIKSYIARNTGIRYIVCEKCYNVSIIDADCREAGIKMKRGIPIGML